MRLTTAQALVRFLASQWSERDGAEQRLIAGCLGIFGHGNVAGIGQALAEQGAGVGGALPYYPARNEQAMVHTATGFARTRDRLSTLACTTSIGPGATNMVTGAALATINRLPVLLLPGDVFATRAAGTLLQELEDPRGPDVSVNDTLRPVSRFFARIDRPEQLPAALLAAMRVLTDPAETGAVTLALPQDVQAEAFDWPEELFARRVWHVARPVPEPAALARALEMLRRSRRPLVVAGGGVKYSGACEALAAFAARHGVPVAETQAGKGALPHDHPCAVGAIGHTGTAAANALAREADLVIGVGTRYTDFTTASRTLFGPAAFLNVNVTAFDAAKHAGETLVADAREALEALRPDDWRAEAGWTGRAASLADGWRAETDRIYGGTELTQPVLLGVLNEIAADGVVVNAAGSMPGDLHKLWRAADPGNYHVEYGYSCMGYEIAGGL
ncbi:thiamine pyrophosphate-binding protein, partial [Streptosporangium sp. NPDC048047]|uniref:thiamine pyrophosphate-binding protein n=1 Tax=Streptosporangium sp. NPDC048047 TaxID=3155748 RepID=UPI0034308AE4